jgi:cyclophilin family peptidyl-prolyl cis-trans isomerase
MIERGRFNTFSHVALSVVALLIALVTFANPSMAKPHWLFAGKPAAAPAAATAEPVVVMETNKGVIKIRVFTKEAPRTAANFLDLVNKGFYNGLTFHRYEPGFCCQGGDPNGNGTGGYTDSKTGQERRIPLEVSPDLKHDKAGVVAMARSSDPNSASSQFYFTLGPASFLDMKYAVFGRVVDGLDVMMSLRKDDKMVKVYEEKAKG